MKKILLAIILYTATAYSSLAQTTKTIGSGKFSIGVDAAVTTGNASMMNNIGIAGSVKYEVSAATDFYVSLSVGYEVFLLKNEYKFLGQLSSSGYIPLKGGIKYYFEKGIFAELQAGASIYAGKESFTSFIYSPGIGYTFDGNFEIGARYEAWVKSGTFGQVALRLAFRF